MSKKIHIGMIDTLSELIGIDAARNLALIYGGTQFYFSNSPVCFLRLAVMMDEGSAQKLIKEFKGLKIEIPRYADVTRKKRDLEIKADKAAGMTVREIAINHEMTERNARTILNNII